MQSDSILTIYSPCMHLGRHCNQNKRDSINFLQSLLLTMYGYGYLRLPLRNEKLIDSNGVSMNDTKRKTKETSNSPVGTESIGIFYETSPTHPRIINS